MSEGQRPPEILSLGEGGGGLFTSSPHSTPLDAKCARACAVINRKYLRASQPSFHIKQLHPLEAYFLWHIYYGMGRNEQKNFGYLRPLHEYRTSLAHSMTHLEEVCHAIFKLFLLSTISRNVKHKEGCLICWCRRCQSSCLPCLNIKQDN